MKMPKMSLFLPTIIVVAALFSSSFIGKCCAGIDKKLRSKNWDDSSGSNDNNQAHSSSIGRAMRRTTTNDNNNTDNNSNDKNSSDSVTGGKRHGPSLGKSGPLFRSHSTAVYNVDKKDFRSVVQKLTSNKVGTHSHGTTASSANQTTNAAAPITFVQNMGANQHFVGTSYDDPITPAEGGQPNQQMMTASQLAQIKQQQQQLQYLEPIDDGTESNQGIHRILTNEIGVMYGGDNAGDYYQYQQQPKQQIVAPVDGDLHSEDQLNQQQQTVVLTGPDQQYLTDHQQQMATEHHFLYPLPEQLNQTFGSPIYPNQQINPNFVYPDPNGQGNPNFVYPANPPFNEHFILTDQSTLNMADGTALEYLNPEQTYVNNFHPSTTFSQDFTDHAFFHSDQIGSNQFVYDESAVDLNPTQIGFKQNNEIYSEFMAANQFLLDQALAENQQQQAQVDQHFVDQMLLLSCPYPNDPIMPTHLQEQFQHNFVGINTPLAMIQHDQQVDQYLSATAAGGSKKTLYDEHSLGQQPSQTAVDHFDHYYTQQLGSADQQLQSLERTVFNDSPTFLLPNENSATTWGTEHLRHFESEWLNNNEKRKMKRPAIEAGEGADKFEDDHQTEKRFKNLSKADMGAATASASAVGLPPAAFQQEEEELMLQKEQNLVKQIRHIVGLTLFAIDILPPSVNEIFDHLKHDSGPTQIDHFFIKIFCTQMQHAQPADVVKKTNAWILEDGQIKGNKMYGEVIAELDDQIKTIFGQSWLVNPNSKFVVQMTMGPDVLLKTSVLFFYRRLYRKLIGFLKAPYDKSEAQKLKNLPNKSDKAALIVWLIVAMEHLFREFASSLNKNNHLIKPLTIGTLNDFDRIEKCMEEVNFAIFALDVTVGPLIGAQVSVSKSGELMQQIAARNIGCLIMAKQNCMDLPREFVAWANSTTMRISYAQTFKQLFSTLINELIEKHQDQNDPNCIIFAKIYAHLYVTILNNGTLSFQHEQAALFSYSWPTFEEVKLRHHLISQFLATSVHQLNALISYWEQTKNAASKGKQKINGK